MASALLNFFLDLLRRLLEVILIPLNVLISGLINLYVPDLNGVLNTIGSYFGILGDYLSFALSYLGFYPELIAFAVGIITAIVLIPFEAHAIKLVVKWWHALH